MITVVTANSGRCGTSLCMQMLHAAGVPVFWNRLPNESSINPRGHYEVDWRFWDTSKAEWLRYANSHNAAIKLFWSKIQRGLPIANEYQFIELKRDAQSMFDSQAVMLREENRMAEKADPRRTIAGIRQSQDELSQWLVGKRTLSLWFNSLQSGTACEPIADFLGLSHTAVAQMRRCIEPGLWHFKPEGKR